MSVTCPRCGLFNPDEALRCDCGYDFAAKAVRPSYLTEHVVQKHGGLQPFLEAESRRNIRNGALLLALGAAFSVGVYLVSQAEGGPGRIGFPLVPLVWGIVLLVRGFNHRSAAGRAGGSRTGSD
jgi:hypothetical protein